MVHAILNNTSVFTQCYSKRETVIIVNKTRCELFDPAGYILWNYYGGAIDISDNPFRCHQFTKDGLHLLLCKIYDYTITEEIEQDIPSMMDEPSTQPLPDTVPFAQLGVHQTTNQWLLEPVATEPPSQAHTFPHWSTASLSLQ